MNGRRTRGGFALVEAATVCIVAGLPAALLLVAGSCANDTGIKGRDFGGPEPCPPAVIHH